MCIKTCFSSVKEPPVTTIGDGKQEMQGKGVFTPCLSSWGFCDTTEIGFNAHPCLSLCNRAKNKPLDYLFFRFNFLAFLGFPCNFSHPTRALWGV